MRFGSCAIVGRTNVGKSTFLNAVLGQRLAITSPLPQTTRDVLLGIAQHGDAQIAFVDTPGLHDPKHELGRRMNLAALDALRTTDLVVLMTDVGHLTKLRKTPDPSPELVLEADRKLIAEFPSAVPCIFVVNKVDSLKDKTRLLPYLQSVAELREFTAIVPVSVLKDDGVQIVLDEIAPHLPEGPPGYDPDMLTDKPLTFFVREYVREQVMLQLRAEIPHAVAVTVERFDETERNTQIKATIHVEKTSQRGVVVGKQGERIKAIGTKARERLQELLERPVHLELFVRVTERWKDVPRQLTELGYNVADAVDLSPNPRAKS